MDDRSDHRAHWSFWLISAIALVWNLAGIVNFFAQMDPEILARYRDSERAIVASRPAWATVAFAIAVFGGALGCLLLLARKSAATYLFVASFIGVIVTMIHTLGTDIEFGAAEIGGIILSPIVVAGFLIWYSRHAEATGWIGQGNIPSQ